MPTLVIMRHGESEANRDNIFTGWSDVSLTEKGINQAHTAGKIIAKSKIQFDDVHTSFLKRAIITTNIVLDEINQNFIPEHKSWRLNERHYGGLRGKNKLKVKEQVGAKQLKIWRRSFTVVPPLLTKRDEDSRYDRYGVKIPLGESLQMAQERLIPYWVDHIAPRLLDGKNQLIVAHGSTLRALIKFLENISDEDIPNVEVPNGKPIRYDFDQHLNIIDKNYME
ncbi:2,3-bisphosphoglycerate-dependent phosphoglycerate mutase [Lentilactobacillus kefiri]|uniref:2,3-bisphosphoglycerate-dependent phosphoglycerate mutase n=1 Tax=Lentilactobacillus kefiri TaxID=33962 RepID=A0A511DVK8_LENKE|nr:2,3-bisphosphoglycerate-dependent phosphoglycerate mutase [Lentilactobacillus kefiri]MCJ2161454.1 2,3-bisphosphoglycerate-dependent phosphoglycerate mutase [Lentilactobacillus kefiri]MCP9368391.1 2,3-bisphosphoglycerate-dependent phosphoglycerate mutase [Lentilactobacillus kefiri]MDH5107780.1 2,3-bisphosphoglycerate-dependent phosphoglycerate mutase [Lentilactobacillus kefiri]MDM7492207.1 2,3-bisphosphoglycerate-dependent phosphoglycerate mutase [Lentilactobacillus kefiri]PAK83409.1 phospho